jgi:hypothetical protein
MVLVVTPPAGAIPPLRACPLGYPRLGASFFHSVRDDQPPSLGTARQALGAPSGKSTGLVAITTRTAAGRTNHALTRATIFASEPRPRQSRHHLYLVVLDLRSAGPRRFRPGIARLTTCASMTAGTAAHPHDRSRLLAAVLAGASQTTALGQPMTPRTEQTDSPLVTLSATIRGPPATGASKHLDFDAPAP